MGRLKMETRPIFRHYKIFSDIFFIPKLIILSENEIYPRVHILPSNGMRVFFQFSKREQPLLAIN